MSNSAACGSSICAITASRTFRHVADGKSLDFSIDIDDNLPLETIHTDAKRLQQVLKNLLSNALKFTERGSVRLHIERAMGGWSASHPVLNRCKNVIAFSVTDTGIGIPQDKQRIIFEAFQQADGTTSRKYGGTGLGLSISRELARLLGGEIRLQSAPGIGSTFTLYLPQVYLAMQPASKVDTPRLLEDVKELPGHSIGSLIGSALSAGNGVANGQSTASLEPVQLDDAAIDLLPATIVENLVIDDDRNLIRPGDPILLIIEDDVTFARILLDLAHEKNLRVLVALRGGPALALAREFKPGAITLDINLPDMAGWTILDRLKHDPATRHIPVHIISGDENRRRGLALGAMTYLEKATTRETLQQAFTNIEQSVQYRVKKLLLVTDDASRRRKIQQSLEGDDIEILTVTTGGEALATIRQQYLDSIVIDLRLADIPALDLVEEIQAETVFGASFRHSLQQAQSERGGSIEDAKAGAERDCAARAIARGIARPHASCCCIGRKRNCRKRSVKFWPISAAPTKR